MKYRPLSLSGAVTLAGCTTPSADFEFMTEIVSTSAWSIIVSASGSVLLSILVGCVYAVCSFIFLRRLGAYRWDWPPARWFRAATLLLMVAILPVLFAGVGFYHGLYRGAKTVLSEGRLPEEIYPSVGQAGADLIAALYVVSSEYGDSEADPRHLSFPHEQVEAYRAGVWALDLRAFSDRLGSFDEQLLDRALRPVRANLEQRYPQLREGAGRTALNWSIEHLAELMQEAALRRDERTINVGGKTAFVLDGLGRGGKDPQALSHSELARAVVSVAVVEPLLLGLRAFARSHQVVLVIMILVVTWLPPAAFRIVHFTHQRWQRRRKGRLERDETVLQPGREHQSMEIQDALREGEVS